VIHPSPLNPPKLGFFLLVAVTLLWGVNWPVMKIAVEALGPWTFRALMVPVGGLVLLTIARLTSQPIVVPSGHWRLLLVASLFNVAGWHILSAFGVSHMASGQAALIAFTMPLWAALIGVAFLGEPMTARRAAALVLGLGGIAVLMPHVFTRLDEQFLGIAFMLATAIAWAIGVVIQKQVRWQMPVIAVAGWQLLIGGLPIALVAALVEDIDFARVPPGAWAAVAFNLIGPLCFCTWAWYKVIDLFPVRVSSISVLLAPAIGVVTAGLALGEPMGWREAAAVILISSALALELILRRPNPIPTIKGTEP
jgi:drug/metabolite transporter (DMT)-like permease